MYPDFSKKAFWRRQRVSSRIETLEKRMPILDSTSKNAPFQVSLAPVMQSIRQIRPIRDPQRLGSRVSRKLFSVTEYREFRWGPNESRVPVAGSASL